MTLDKDKIQPGSLAELVMKKEAVLSEAERLKTEEDRASAADIKRAEELRQRYIETSEARKIFVTNAQEIDELIEEMHIDRLLTEVRDNFWPDAQLVPLRPKYFDKFVDPSVEAILADPGIVVTDDETGQRLLGELKHPRFRLMEYGIGLCRTIKTTVLEQDYRKISSGGWHRSSFPDVSHQGPATYSWVNTGRQIPLDVTRLMRIESARTRVGWFGYSLQFSYLSTRGPSSEVMYDVEEDPKFNKFYVIRKTPVEPGQPPENIRHLIADQLIKERSGNIKF